MKSLKKAYIAKTRDHYNVRHTIECHKIVGLSGLHLSDGVAVQLSRGPKVSTSSPAPIIGGEAMLEQPVSLECTMYASKKGDHDFLEKKFRISIITIQHRLPVDVAFLEIDMSEFSSATLATRFERRIPLEVSSKLRTPGYAGAPATVHLHATVCSVCLDSEPVSVFEEGLPTPDKVGGLASAAAGGGRGAPMRPAQSFPRQGLPSQKAEKLSMGRRVLSFGRKKKGEAKGAAPGPAGAAAGAGVAGGADPAGGAISLPRATPTAVLRSGPNGELVVTPTRPAEPGAAASTISGIGASSPTALDQDPAADASTPLAAAVSESVRQYVAMQSRQHGHAAPGPQPSAEARPARPAPVATETAAGGESAPQHAPPVSPPGAGAASPTYRAGRRAPSGSAAAGAAAGAGATTAAERSLQAYSDRRTAAERRGGAEQRSAGLVAAEAEAEVGLAQAREREAAAEARAAAVEQLTENLERAQAANAELRAELRESDAMWRASKGLGSQGEAQEQAQAELREARATIAELKGELAAAATGGAAGGATSAEAEALEEERWARTVAAEDAAEAARGTIEQLQADVSEQRTEVDGLHRALDESAEEAEAAEEAAEAAEKRAEEAETRCQEAFTAEEAAVRSLLQANAKLELLEKAVAGAEEAGPRRAAAAIREAEEMAAERLGEAAAEAAAAKEEAAAAQARIYPASPMYLPLVSRLHLPCNLGSISPRRRPSPSCAPSSRRWRWLLGRSTRAATPRPRRRPPRASPWRARRARRKQWPKLRGSTRRQAMRRPSPSSDRSSPRTAALRPKIPLPRRRLCARR